MSALKHCEESINGVTPGTWISSVSENGGSSSFSALYDFTPIMAKRLIGELLDAYDNAIEWFCKQGNDQPTDADIYKRLMRHNLRSIRRYKNDYTGLRYGVGFYVE